MAIKKGIKWTFFFKKPLINEWYTKIAASEIIKNSKIGWLQKECELMSPNESNIGNKAQCMAQSTDVVAPQKSIFAITFLKLENIKCNKVAI